MDKIGKIKLTYKFQILLMASSWTSSKYKLFSNNLNTKHQTTTAKHQNHQNKQATLAQCQYQDVYTFLLVVVYHIIVV